MAKNDNLKDFLTDVADAIREKKGTTDLINPQDFSAEIASIQSGGGAVAVSAKAVNFRDYDGTILHSYTKDEFLALTELPPLPTREGLICQEWNWEYADAVEYVTEYGVLEVGATYITDDGKTRLYITIAAEGRMDVPLYFQQDVANGVTIDWGDGSATETLSGTGGVNTTHHYNAIGDYIISLEVADGCKLSISKGEGNSCVMGETGNSGLAYCNMLKKVELGNNLTMAAYALNKCASLKTITIPLGITFVGTNVFTNCSSLSYVCVPNDWESISSYAFENCKSLIGVSLPKSLKMIYARAFREASALGIICIPSNVTSIESNSFYNCVALQKVTIPSKVASVGASAFYGCKSLAEIVLPNSITSIGTSFFYSCESLISVVVSNNIKTLPSETFRYCSSLRKADFTNFNSVPSLSATNAFGNNSADRRIVVPDLLYDAWISATNWSVIAAAIIKKSEWDALNA